MVLVGCLAAGVMLASDVFHSGSNIETLLFGSLLLIDGRDIALAAAAAAASLGATVAVRPPLAGRRLRPHGGRSRSVPETPTSRSRCWR